MSRLAARQDENIVKCAERMVRKLNESRFRTMNGAFPNPVQVEIERMKKHCMIKDA